MNFQPELYDWFDWPAKGQDLNIIENVFAELQKGVGDLMVQLNPTSSDELWSIILTVVELIKDNGLLMKKY